MEAEDIIELRTCGSYSGGEGADASELSKSHAEDEVEGHVGNGQNNVGQIMDDPEIEEGQLVSEAEITRDVIDDSSFLHERVDFVESAETQVLDCVAIHTETGCVNDTEVEEGQLVPETESAENAAVNATDFTENVAELQEKHVYMRSENGCVAKLEASNSYPEKSGSVTGVRRMRPTSECLQPSVHVKYHGLSRQSKRKLEQLLQEWSEWCARNASCLHDQDEVQESGEEIYFPALDVGMGKTSTVSFWMESEGKKPQDKDFVHVVDDSVPLYDRGFALGLTSAEGSNNLGGGVEVLDAPRCFNCGSYSHSLKECPKPRDNAVVNNSRKQLKSRRNQTAGMRNLTRYYQDSPGGKYEGLKPGVLAPETRRLLGLGEFDPPPWLNRMREIGYPPGYLEPDDENLPSGIAIYADEDIKEDKEEGEILEAETVDPPRKMSVKIQGINAPIPQNADERLWAARPSKSECHRNRDSARSNHYSESSSRGRYREHSNRDFKDDDPHSLDRASRYPPRSPSFRGSPSDKEKNDPLDSEDSLAYRLYSSYSYNPSRGFSEHSNSSEADRDGYPDYSSRNRDRGDRHRHRSGR